jgi:DNA-binding MarR family transcriptional regulator
MPSHPAEPVLSYQTLKVLRIFADNPNDSFAGSDIAKVTKILSGVMYPMLMRLERARWLHSKWEGVDASSLGRPRKRLYRITPTGLRKTRAAFAELGLGAVVDQGGVAV